MKLRCSKRNASIPRCQKYVRLSSLITADDQVHHRSRSPQKETPGASAPGAIPILEFRNSYPRRRILSTQNDNDHIFPTVIVSVRASA
jgi:hypothetical protein